MATEIITSFGQQSDANGVPMSGAKIYVYDVETTTLKSVYSDPGLDPGDLAANPIVCDSSGRHDMRYIATGSYKVVVKTSADVSVYTRDNIDGRIPVGSGALAIANGGTSATTANGALAALGAATASEVADLAADVASLAGAAASSEKTHIATGTTAQRPASGSDGDIRRNTTTGEWEGYTTNWFNFKTSEDSTSTAAVTAETAEDTYLRPDRLKYSQRTAIAWAHVTYSGGTPTLANTFGFASIVDEGVGDLTLNFSATQPNANYAVSAISLGSGSANFVNCQAKSTTAVRIKNWNVSASGVDPTSMDIIVFGDFS